MTPCVTLGNKPKKDDGYVRIMVDGRRVYAHRYHYEKVHGELAEGLEIDHTCENRACVNLDHLRAVTHLENMSHARTRNLHTGFCRNGHDLSIAGIYNHPTSGPTCRECKRDTVRRYRAKLNKVRETKRFNNLEEAKTWLEIK